MQSVVRLVAFLAGVIVFHIGERAVPHHRGFGDLRARWAGNFGLSIVNGIVVSLACWVCLAYQAPGLAIVNLSALPQPARAIVELLLLDVLTYLLHRGYHEVPFMWRLHMVHHTDEDLDVSSASRFHPGEVVLSSAIKLAFVYALGISAVSLITFEIVMLACAQFEHSNLRVAPWLERWMWPLLVPPEMHRIHHSPAKRDTNSNYGTVLTVWDRIFGTFNRRRRETTEPFGIDTAATPPNDVIRLLLLPFRRAPRPAPSS